MKIYIDIDNTIFNLNSHNLDYSSAIPNKDLINIANDLYKSGLHTIVYWTARGTKSKIDYYQLTKSQLDSAGVLYHDLIMGKPDYDLLIDDKTLNNLLLLKNIKSIFNI